jgi:RTX calcium-binding nonapeptide repeat (4 copies)
MSARSSSSPDAALIASERGYVRYMRRPGKTLVLVSALAIAAVVAPSSAAARQPAVSASVSSVDGGAAAAASSLNVLTLNDPGKIDNRISAHIGPTGRLVLTAPEGLGDPDGSGLHCTLDNANPGQSSAQQVSCAAGYIGAIVGDLNSGNDTFSAEPGLTVLVGAVIDGERRPLFGGLGRDRLVGGTASDLLDGEDGPDAVIGMGGEDFLIGGSGSDKLKGGTGGDVLMGLTDPDRLNGGPARDLCKGGGASDTGKSCEISRGIP